MLAKVAPLKVPDGVILQDKKRKYHRDKLLKVSTDGTRDAECVASELVQNVLRENDFIDETTTWTGTHMAIHKTDHKYIINLRAATDSFFCVFKECEEIHGQLKRRENPAKHTSSGKQIFKIIATSEKAVLRQSCFHCQKPEKQLCPLNADAFQQVQILLFENGNKKKNHETMQKVNVEKWSLL